MNVDRDLIPFVNDVLPALGVDGPSRPLQALLIKGNRKSVFPVFRRGDSRPIVIVKFARDPVDRPRIENEKAATDTLVAWMPGLGDDILAPGVVRDIGNGIAYARRASRGNPLARRISPVPAGTGPDLSEKHVDLAVGWLIDLQVSTRDRVEALGGRDTALETMRAENPAFAHLDPDTPAFARVAGAVADGTLPLVVEHGDYNPDNLFEDRRSLNVIDWEWGRIPGLPLVDLFEFALQSAKAAAIQGVVRSRPIGAEDVRAALGDNPFASHIRARVAGAADALSIPAPLASDLLTMHLSRYFPPDAVEGIVTELPEVAS